MATPLSPDHHSQGKSCVLHVDHERLQVAVVGVGFTHDLNHVAEGGSAWRPETDSEREMSLPGQKAEGPQLHKEPPDDLTAPASPESRVDMAKAFMCAVMQVRRPLAQ